MLGACCISGKISKITDTGDRKGYTLRYGEIEDRQRGGMVGEMTNEWSMLQGRRLVAVFGTI
jgi:hypothetical protein